ncbi:MAG: adenylosuccinate synthetase, partial [Elusimicrobia bacterium]|nr:adenylosuccinate synthetase [Elusimicrobiota bacterium]
MPNLIVIGTQWGDEGKGKVVHFLLRRAKYVVRYQGGANAGHTVILNHKPLALHLIPTGALIPRIHNVIGHGVVVDPRSLREEVLLLKKHGLNLQERLHVSLGAHVILPSHIQLDTLREKGGLSLGTTRRGIGPCTMDKVGRIGIQMADYLQPPLFKELLERNLRWHEKDLKSFGSVSQLSREVLRDYPKLRNFMEPFCTDTATLIQKAIHREEWILFEGAQGIMLDLDFGTYPFVTSSNPVAGGVCAGGGVGPTQLQEVLGVAKAYT